MGASPTVNFFDKSIIAFLYYFNKRILNNYCIFFCTFCENPAFMRLSTFIFFSYFLIFYVQIAQNILHVMFFNQSALYFLCKFCTIITLFYDFFTSILQQSAQILLIYFLFCALLPLLTEY